MQQISDNRRSGLGGSLFSSLGSALGQLRAHQLVQQVHGLERAYHHLEMGDLAVGKADDVDAVDLDAVDFFFEFEHGAAVTAPLADISEAFAAEYLLGAGEIFEGDVASALRRMDHGTLEHRLG